MSASISTLPSLYKTLFSPGQVYDLSYGDNNVLWALLDKETNFTGDGEKVAIEHAPPGGRSADFATAKTLMGHGGEDAHFLLTRHKDYQLISLDGESIDAAEGNDGAFVDLFTSRTKRGITNLARQLNFDLYRSGSGSRGRIATSGISTTTLTLATIYDATGFEVGMEVVVGPNDSSTGLRAGSATITGINRKEGKLITDSNWSAQITSPTDADYIFVKGDASSKVKGLDAYCPGTAPTSGDSLYGLDRSVDDRLSGVRAGDLSTMAIEEALLQLNFEIYTYGKGLTKVNLMHALKYTDLIKSYQNRTIPYVNTKFGNIGFEGIKVSHAGGQSVVYGDRDCQYTTMWGIDPSVLTFRSLKMAPRPLDYKETTKSGAHFDPDADGLVLRMGYRGALRNKAPSFMGRATI
jgi:hypothetical protein